MNPLHPTLRSADGEADKSGWSWHRRAWLASAVDVALVFVRLFNPGKNRRRPELDEQKGPVSLREAYSTRYMDGMLQYDDARRYIEMMQRRIFDSVERFLEDHNVDTGSYVQQTTVILQNSGVVNYGAMGNVQNQPGATNSHQNQTNTGSGSDQLKEFSALLDRIRRQLAAEQGRVDDYQQCVVLLDLTAQQRLDDTGGRTVARTTLEQILTKCDGIPGLVSLLSSALSLIATFA
ncbi:hypothetical protein [Streptomyces prunicolor]|uniref:hypothetical protein n=1 Tax=Streptomyces prunicolor TaxID=67348 RepID=UPI0033FC0F13